MSSAIWLYILKYLYYYEWTYNAPSHETTNDENCPLDTCSGCIASLVWLNALFLDSAVAGFQNFVTENEFNRNLTVRNDRLRLFCQAKFVPLPNFFSSLFGSGLPASLQLSKFNFVKFRC